MYFVYSIDEPGAGDAANTVAANLGLRFGESPDFYLGRCEAAGEDSFTLLDMRRTVELKTEYLSFRGTEPGPMVS
ncbi:hypothetical protein Y5W_01354 [Alcanivorax sp. 521-1]|uniref:Uncharacterized protein n=1 Tax=Alloalcanivorax profundimaris TaxID=2735259 RepID=A0ABS0APJ8_9GAMM|nr:hypothetical protein [Alloalcanivorax profundimaris]